MPRPLLNKLKHHLRRTGKYPPIIVRPIRSDGPSSADTYQILDGHHRMMVLKELGHDEAKCDVWEVSDDEALLLLATLNRLEGKDDAHKRADLVANLLERAGDDHDDNSDVAAMLPEAREALAELMRIREPPPQMAAPPPLEAMPVPVHFFLLPKQRKQLTRVLGSIDSCREVALMRMVERCSG